MLDFAAKKLRNADLHYGHLCFIWNIFLEYLRFLEDYRHLSMSESFVWIKMFLFENKLMNTRVNSVWIINAQGKAISRVYCKKAISNFDWMRLHCNEIFGVRTLMLIRISIPWTIRDTEILRSVRIQAVY